MMNNIQHFPETTKRRKIFVFKTSLFFTIFVSLTIAHLLLTIRFKNISNIFKDICYINVAAFCVGMFLFLIYFFVGNVRLNGIFNWMVAFLIVECMTLSLLTTSISFSFWQLFSSIVVALCAVILFFIIAIVVKQDFTLDVVFLFVFSYVFCIGTVYFLTLYVIDKVSMAIYICLGIIILLIYLFNMYFAQCIMGGHHAEIRLSDYMLAALIIYLNFFLLLLISINFVPLFVNVVEKSLK